VGPWLKKNRPCTHRRYKKELHLAGGGGTWRFFGGGGSIRMGGGNGVHSVRRRGEIVPLLRPEGEICLEDLDYLWFVPEGNHSPSA